MTRYKVLRELCGCSPFTAGFIATLNWIMGVPKGRAVGTERRCGMRHDYCPIANEPCQSLCDVPCGKTDYQSLLREALVHFYHDGVPTDSEHPKRITVNKIEKALK